MTNHILCVPFVIPFRSDPFFLFGGCKLAVATIEKQVGSELCQAQEILTIVLVFIIEGQTAQYLSARVTFLQKITFNGKLF